jgi:hypothetical protein
MATCGSCSKQYGTTSRCHLPLCWAHEKVRVSPKLRVPMMSRPPLACAFAPSLPVVSGYFRRTVGMAAPMRSKASCWRLVGWVRTGMAVAVPGKCSSLRVSVLRWARSPW